MTLFGRSLSIVAVSLCIVGPIRGHAENPPVQSLLDEARATRSDALYLIRGDEVLADWESEEGGGPIELMSALKSLVAIAVGHLLYEGDIESLDQPVHTLYPEWNQGRKKDVTIRHLLNHTSGLQNLPNAGAEIYPAPDAIKLAIAAELSNDPGEKFSYNNKAVNLLAGVIERASGKRMDLYFRDELFGPMSIDTYQWYFDASGSPHAMAGLRLYARDVAKFGLLIIDNGMWQGERLVSEAFIEEMLAPGQSHYPLCGLLWWRLPETQSVRLKREALDTSEAPGDVSSALAEIGSRTFGNRREARAALSAAIGDDYSSVMRSSLGEDWFDELFDWRIGTVQTYYADGYLGQYLVVVPQAGVVAVRQIRQKDGLGEETAFADFPALIRDLARTDGARGR